MGLEAVISKNCVQTAVYWGSPVEDGYGGKTWGDPVEIDCRWEETMQVMLDKDGEEITSRAAVYVTQDLEENGVLYLGTLDDLDSDQEADPLSNNAAYTIKRFAKTPVLGSTTQFRRVAFLTPALSFGGF